MIYDDTSTAELEQRFDDLYAQINAGLDSLPMATWTEPYRAAKRTLMTLETEFHAIGAELARRSAFQQEAWAEVTRPARAAITGCTCGGIGVSGAHRPDCAWSML